jgi:hypothetical protein
VEFVAVEGERLRDAESCAQVIDEFERAASIVAVHPLAALVTLLRLYRERSDRASFEPFERDRLADILAVAVGAVIEPLQRSVDLGDQLTLAVARAQLNRAVGLRGRPIGKIGMVLVLVLEMLQRLLGYLEDILPPGEQLVAEILPLALVHERLFVGGPVGLVHIRLDRDPVLVSVRNNSDAVLLVHLRFQLLQNKAPLLAGELI